MQFLVNQKVTLKTPGRDYTYNDILTVEKVGQERIDRYLKLGYITALVDPETDDIGTGLPSYMTADEYLSADEVNALERKALIEYAKCIGTPDFKANISTKNLQKLINDFIDSQSEDGDE